MQGWMIALIVVAAFIALVAIAFLAGMLIFVHAILGRRKELSEQAGQKKGYTADKFGVDPVWFDFAEKTTSQATITAYDGVKLGARIIRQSEPTGRVAVLCHGYGATLRSTQVQAKLFYDRGFDVYMLAMRGHKGSGGKVGMAWIDRFDLSRWIDRIVTDYGEQVQIALFGVSMGGSTVVAYAGMEPKPQVKCVIDDCGFSTQYDEYIACLKAARLPKCSIHLFNAGVKLVHGYSLYDADITKLAASMTCPALFFHGTADDFVPFDLGQKLFDSCASPEKSFVAIDGAGHACAYITDKEKYVSAFTEFIDAHIEGSQLVHEPSEYTDYLAALEAERQAKQEQEQQAEERAEQATSEQEQEESETPAEQAAESVTPAEQEATEPAEENATPDAPATEETPEPTAALDD
ncbi:MAG: alpha/beta fold hydrolase [Clostridiales bacterium]|nr:alpha/beta fold hydrolase [Clostridiales bacterium]